MNFDHSIHDRQSIRLPGYDYSQPGAYFITLVTRGRESLFGEIVNGEMRLNAIRRIVEEVWMSLPNRYPPIDLGAAIVRPNHFHGVVEIQDDAAAPGNSVEAIHELPLQNFPEDRLSQRMELRRMTLPLVVGYLKMNTAKRINQILGSPVILVWQRNYYEHIIQSEEEYQRIQSYIVGNPGKWTEDDENPLRANPISGRGNS
ncbi:hypothetical protein LARV_03824 [Longilinea arvoryzae]|uniref:Transposase IS200-like domain-containing protein n=1 Tax=Longilinea arvoryzae TaxID=360412 RepID=A0A0K8MXP0_9CHLR|nr:transposase [Longilinea arvoryzae]GAP16028.1 hypothetical protein LARV_03824 [Longilinea arvoryzae]